jgi:DNA-binding SARP family transcriptional activator
MVPSSRSRLSLRLLGGVEGRLPDGTPIPLPSRKAQALLAYLALPAGQWHPRDKLAALLWGEASNERARHSLRQALVGLRRALPDAGPASLLEERDVVSLNPEAWRIDAADFERLAGSSAAADLASAAELYAGDLLAGLSVSEPAFEEWLVGERERLRETALEALARLLTQQMAAEQDEPAIRTALRLLTFDPAQEAVHRALMRLYVRQGRRGAALRQYQVCVGALERELGATPEMPTRELYLDLLQTPGRVVSLAEARQLSSDSTGIHETALVGRDDALATLEAARARAWAGAGQVAVVRGEAGIGKTRLVDALARRAAADGGRVLTGHSHETERVLAFGPWVEALRSGGAPAALRAASSLDGPWRAELARLVPELSDEARAPGEDVARLFDALGRAVAALAEAQPVLLVLEDLHWADDMSARLLAFLGRRLGSMRVFLVVTARAEELEDAPVLRAALAELDRHGAAAELALAPLGEDDALDLVHALSPASLDSREVTDLGRRVWAMSEGNPFVIVEAMRGIREAGADGARAALALPERVRAVTAARIERLAEPARHVLAVAAVLGRGLEFPVLEAAAARPAAVVASAVEALVARRLLHSVDERLEFTHDRIREVAYDAVLPARRAELHAAAAEALLARGGDDRDELADRAALHFARSTRHDRAVELLARSAARAARAYAHTQAVTLLEDALRHAERLPAAGRDRATVTLLVQLGNALPFLGRFQAIVDRLAPWQDRVEALGEGELASAYFFRLGLARQYLGELASAADAGERALVHARHAGSEVALGRAEYLLGLVLPMIGRIRDGIGHARAAVARMEGGRDRQWHGYALLALSQGLILAGEVEGSLAAAEAMSRVGEEERAHNLVVFGLFFQANAHATRGDTARAVEICRQSLERARDPVSRAMASGRLGQVLCAHGEPAAAVPVLEEAVSALRSFRYRILEALNTAHLADALRGAGELARADEVAAQAVAQAREIGFEFVGAWAERVQGQIAAARGEAGAAATLRRAHGHFAAIGARLEAGRTAALLLELVSDPAARAALHDEARAAFADAGATALLERLEAPAS